MSKWEWQGSNIIYGSGQLIKKGSIIKFSYIENFKVKFRGRYTPKAHKKIAWIKPQSLREIDLAPADIPIAEEVIRQEQEMQHG